jgi:hypothetical protein
MNNFATQLSIRAGSQKDVKYAIYRKSGFAKANGQTLPGFDSLVIFDDLERLYGRSEFQAAAANDAGRLGRTDGR